MQNPWAQKQTGFTIVELLIVIVVIAILAAITIVAYNGIQTRAQNSTIQSDLSNLVKKLELYKVASTDTRYPISLPELQSAEIRLSSLGSTKIIFCGNATGTAYTLLGGKFGGGPNAGYIWTSGGSRTESNTAIDYSGGSVLSACQAVSSTYVVAYSGNQFTN